MPATSSVPVETTDAVNARVLSMSEDKIQGFHADPLGEIARASGVDLETVIERIRAMLEAGTIRRVRQTLMATNLAPGSLVAWQIPEEKLQDGFDWMFQNDPFSGHVVIRSTDADIPGARYRLWTTLKVPQNFSMEAHCEFLMCQTGATAFKLMPAKRLFALGVGHVRRRLLEPGSKSDEPGAVLDTTVAQLSPLEWRVLTGLKREFAPDELVKNLWDGRAEEAGVSLDEFLRIARLERARHHRALFNVSGARQSAFFWRTRNQVQRAVSLACAAGRGNRSGPGSWTISHHDSRLLARGRAGVQGREHHGRGARNGQKSGVGAQSRH